MGLARAAVNLLLLEASRRPFEGSIVTLGRQHVYVTGDEVRAMATRHGVRLHPVPDELHREPHLAAQRYLSDDCLLKMLGFQQIVRVDYSDYEAPDAILDLNSAETPDALRSAFDLVLDSGTIEHVFDIAAALRHCCRMAKPGGRVIHLTPSSNCVEHGFHNVSPTLFADFYSASHFQINRVYLCRIPLDLPRGPWQVYDYCGAPQRFIPMGMLDDHIWFTFSVTTASDQSTPVTPQQWIYVNSWWQSAAKKANGELGSIADEPPESRAGRLLQQLQGSPILSGLARGLIRKWRQLVNWSRTRSRTVPYPHIGQF